MATKTTRLYILIAVYSLVIVDSTLSPVASTSSTAFSTTYSSTITEEKNMLALPQYNMSITFNITVNDNYNDVISIMIADIERIVNSSAHEYLDSLTAAHHYVLTIDIIKTETKPLLFITNIIIKHAIVSINNTRFLQVFQQNVDEIYGENILTIYPLITSQSEHITSYSQSESSSSSDFIFFMILISICSILICIFILIIYKYCIKNIKDQQIKSNKLKRQNGLEISVGNNIVPKEIHINIISVISDDIILPQEFGEKDGQTPMTPFTACSPDEGMVLNSDAETPYLDEGVKRIINNRNNYITKGLNQQEIQHHVAAESTDYGDV